jgi:hypothetical protein
MLNYSLWFTLVWWLEVGAYIFMTEIKKEHINYISFSISLILYPAIAILLEYLLVR